MNNFLEQVDRTPVTFIVLLAYVTMAFVTDPMNPTTAALIKYGAASGELVPAQPWRLLTYAFLHGGILHLGLNSYFLFIIGPALEQRIGSIRYTLLYVIGAVGGGIGGCLWHPVGMPLVGGSAALFAMLGTGLALTMRQGRHLLDFLNYSGPRQLLLLIVANLAIGFLIPVISNAGHIGGLIAGFVLSFCFLERGRNPANDRTARVIQVGWIALYLTLLLYCVQPVVRWDYLRAHINAPDLNERRAYARALLLRTNDLQDPPLGEPAQRPQLVRELRALAEGR